MAYFPNFGCFEVPCLVGQSSHNSFPDPFYQFESHHLHVLDGTDLQEISVHGHSSIGHAHGPNDSSSPTDNHEMTEQVPPQTKMRRERSAPSKGASRTKCAGGKKQKGNAARSKQKTNERDQSTATDYIHVRARRGQATDSHSLAERVRRENISERMMTLQALVPGCDKVTGKALMLDRIITYIQSLQSQVQYLSMRLASMSPIYDSETRQDETTEQAANFKQHGSPTMAATPCIFTETSSDDHHHFDSSNLLQQVQRLFSQDETDGVFPWDVDDWTINISSTELD
ncbi:hypothetical protein QQ045_028456 [Rhodiola kirilowii]